MSVPGADPADPRPRPDGVDWPTCQPACLGRQLAPDGPCLAHADKDQRAVAYQRLAERYSLDFAAGVTFTDELLAELLEHLPRTPTGEPLAHEADFRRARFEGNAAFDDVQFEGDVGFDWAQFTGNTRFDGAQFAGIAWFYGAQFEGDTLFDRARFAGKAFFDTARFAGSASFGGAQFEGHASFHWAQFEGDARFHAAYFGGRAGFDRVGALPGSPGRCSPDRSSARSRSLTRSSWTG